MTGPYDWVDTLYNELLRDTVARILGALCYHCPNDGSWEHWYPADLGMTLLVSSQFSSPLEYLVGFLEKSSQKICVHEMNDYKILTSKL